MPTRESFDELFSKVAQKFNWQNYEVDSDIHHQSVNGFCGDFFLVSIKNKDTKEKLDLAVKKSIDLVSRRELFNISKVYETEIYFYEKLLPSLLEFKDSKNVGALDVFPKCYLTWTCGDQEFLVMKNLKADGFDIIGRENYLDADHVEFIFRTYGKFHALSFAFKDQKPEEYGKLTDDIFDCMRFNTLGDGFMKVMEDACKNAFKFVDKGIQEKCRVYVEDLRRVYEDSLRYKGGYSCLVHGDCWSNNMMFKYEGSKIVNMKLIDFQLTKNDTPVHDLSYFLYAGGTKETFDNLDKYLELYYENFSKMCRDLGSDPNKVYPFEALKEDWRKYSKFGFVLGLMLIKIKNADQSEIQELANKDFSVGFTELKITDENKYKAVVRDLIGHAYENKFL